MASHMRQKDYPSAIACGSRGALAAISRSPFLSLYFNVNERSGFCDGRHRQLTRLAT